VADDYSAKFPSPEPWSENLLQAMRPQEKGLENCRVFTRALLQGLQRILG
jgi:hypothetical protein